MEPDEQPAAEHPADPAPERSAPASLQVAAGATALQGVLVVVLAVAEAVSVVGERLVLGLTTTLFFVLYGGGLLLCAWGLRGVRPWSRGPVLLAQLVWIGLAWNLRTSPAVSAVLVVAAAVVLVGLLHPRSVEAIERARDAE